MPSEAFVDELDLTDVVDGQPPPAEPGGLAFTPRLFTQLCLPYRNPGDVPRWVRRNGGLELILHPGVVVDDKTGWSRPGYPYGVVPRLLVIWMAGEVIRTERQELNLGPSLGAFLAQVGLTRSGTQAARVRDQITRLFTSSLLVTANAKAPGVKGWGFDFVRVAEKAQLWWSDLRPDDPLWTSTVTLSGEFYEAILSGSVPLPTEALAELRGSTRSPMALDIYAWLAHRLRNVKSSTPPISWADLALQFGGDYARVRDFKAQFLKDLANVMVVYPAANVEPGPKGIVLRRSPSPVLARSGTG